MKILLDESVPQKLRLLLEGNHAVSTTWFMEWSGLKNGALLSEAESAGFDLLVTADQELEYQQNLGGRRLAVVVLSTNNWGVIRARVETIVATIAGVIPGCYLFVDIGHERGSHPG